MSFDGKEMCGDCYWFGEDAAKKKVCRRFPPTAVAFVLPGVIGGEPTVAVHSFHPPARDRNPACGEFRPKPEIVN